MWTPDHLCQSVGPPGAMSAIFARSGYPYDNDRMLVDVANSTYAIRNQITARGVRALWATLCNYINSSMLAHKVRRGREGCGGAWAQRSAGATQRALLALWPLETAAGRTRPRRSHAPLHRPLRACCCLALACSSLGRRWRTATRRSSATGRASRCSTAASAACRRSAAASGS